MIRVSYTINVLHIYHKPVQTNRGTKPYTSHTAQSLHAYSAYLYLICNNSDDEETYPIAGEMLQPTLLHEFKKQSVDNSVVCPIVVHQRKLITSTLWAIMKSGF